MPVTENNSRRRSWPWIILNLIIVAVAIFVIIQFIPAKNAGNQTQNSSIELPIATSTLQTPNRTIEVMIADTPELREIGLSGRTELEDDQGMLFIFPTDGEYGFWMKDMNFSIDMIWIDEQKKVIGVTEDIRPDTFPEIFHPPGTIRYVLEVNEGGVKKLNIATGTILKF